MGLNNLTDVELKEILLDNNINELLADKEKLRRFIGMDNITRRRLSDILKYDVGLDNVKIRSIINAAVTDLIIDDIIDVLPFDESVGNVHR